MDRLDRTASPAAHIRRLQGLTRLRVREATASLRPRTRSGRMGAGAVVARAIALRRVHVPWEAVVLTAAAEGRFTDRPVADHTLVRDAAKGKFIGRKGTPPLGAAFLLVCAGQSPAPLMIRYSCSDSSAISLSFFFTRTTVILVKPSSKVGGLSFAERRFTTSSPTTRDRF